MKTIGVNLVPQSIQCVLQRNRWIRFWCAGACLSLIALGVALGYDWLQTCRMSDRADRLAQAQLEVEKLRHEARTLAAGAGLLQQQLERADAMRAKRAWSGLLAVIAAELPPDCRLQSIATDPARPPIDSVVVAAGSKPTTAVSSPTSVPANVPPPARTVLLDAPRKLRLVGFANDPAQPVEFVSALKETGAFTQVNLERAQWEPTRKDSNFRFELVCEW
jgi:Tfp pilus assembly protein PilN